MTKLGKKDFDGQVAIITGAQQGIGKAIAVKLASEGADIVVNWLDDKEKASEVADLVKSQGRKVVMFKGDIGQNDQARNLVSVTMDAFGKIDVLVNNAGIYPRIPFFDVTEKDWNKIIQTNLKGAFFCSQMVAKKMREFGTGGNIINISSQAISGLAKEGSVYSISKTALIGLTKTLAMELAPHRIRVNAIAPSLVNTPPCNLRAILSFDSFFVMICFKYFSALSLGLYPNLKALLLFHHALLFFEIP